MDFSQWLQAEMKRLDLTNYRLAKISSVHQTTISNILNGKKPQIETVNGKSLLAIAVKIGKTRLIDNIILG